MAPTASVYSTKELPSADWPQPPNPKNEYEDAERNYKPKSIKFWTVIIGMYLSFFLVALVSLAIPLLIYILSLHILRIEPSLPQPFLASPTSSNLSRTSAGMAVPTC